MQERSINLNLIYNSSINDVSQKMTFDEKGGWGGGGWKTPKYDDIISEWPLTTWYKYKLKKSPRVTQHLENIYNFGLCHARTCFEDYL